MIGKPEWFKRRKYSGWGIIPKSWKGWAYIAAFLVPLILFNILPFWSVQTRLIVLFAWLIILIADTFHIMVNIPMDEREKKHEAIAERNSLWAMMVIIIIAVLYQAYITAVSQKIVIDWFLIGALLAGVIVKAASNLYLDRHD